MSLGSAAHTSVIPSGIPCWIELACRDEAATQAFYSGLFDWEFTVQRDPATPNGRYSIATLNGVPTGGLYRSGTDGPSGWSVHISVPQAAAAAEWVDSLGGRVTLGPMTIPHRGNIVHAVDACGAHVVFWEPPATWEFATGVPNTFSGADLNTHDGAAADHFYCRLFNYTSHQIGDGTSLDYAEWLIEHEPVLYRYVMGSEYRADTPPHWMVYLELDPARGADAAAGQALMLGGAVVVQPYDTPYGRMAILADPDGSVFAVIDHSRAIEGWGSAEVDDPYDD
ncbi:VOC family protein [Amycolatopsis sp. BJA-103]|uniref:VOC family protein n=1 Tax=unclassified Amycolatopsis TaxID=2618356 RepID=UPI000C766C16|nr:VOC family protein [Amycolatopsis sp. BJA-103]AUI60768.1 glyoxalase [Amycolatopsis sp. BJA-103]PNE21949.1 glyoxalase [Amycolatopsis sp. BJA-103]